MYFFSINKLIEELKSNNLDDQYSLPYLAAILFMTAMAFFMPDPEHNIYDSISSVITAMISVTSVYYCYQCNTQNGENNFFLVKFLSISWVITCRLILCLFLFYTIISIAFDLKETTVWEVVLWAGLDLYIMFRTAHYIKQTLV